VTTTPLEHAGPYARALRRPPRLTALRIALIYLIVGVLWIAFIDSIVDYSFSPEDVHRLHIDAIKDWVFIVITATMLYTLIRFTITIAQTSERAREQTEERTRMLVEHVRDYAIFLLDRDGNVTSWNRGAQQIADWTEAEVVGQNHAVFYTQQDIAAGKPNRDLETAAAEGFFEEEALRKRQDGSEFWANALLTRLGDPKGEPTGYLAVIRDVTERRRVQDALRQSVSTLSGMIQAIPLAVQSIDRQNRVLAWNAASEQLFGWKHEEVEGKPLPTIPEDQREGYATMMSNQWSGTPISGREVIRQKKDGTRMTLSLWTAPLLDASGKVAGSLGIFVDLSERRRSEAEVRQLNETLERRVRERTARMEEANEELQAFSYTVSHDLRIPLRSLQQMASDLISHHGQTLDEEGTSEALRIVGAAARMQTQIEELLEYSRVSRSDLPTEPLSLVLIVHEVLGRLQRDPEFRNAQVVVQEPLGWVKGHRLVLQQVILNLLTNAITFVPQGEQPRVTITAKEIGDTIRLCIEDNGIGIKDEDRARIFQLFERLPAAERYPGLGVGLAVVRRGVERMGGNISVEPAATRGTIFCIELPKAQESPSR